MKVRDWKIIMQLKRKNQQQRMNVWPSEKIYFNGSFDLKRNGEILCVFFCDLKTEVFIHIM
jgi:hypothetical protein